MGYVYLLWEKDTSFYKIGSAKSLEKLVANRQTYNANELVHLASLETADPLGLERMLQRKWAEFKKDREWYNIPPMQLCNLFYDFDYLPIELKETLDKHAEMMVRSGAMEGARLFLNTLKCSEETTLYTQEILLSFMAINEDWEADKAVMINSNKLVSNYVLEVFQKFGLYQALTDCRKSIADHKNGIRH